MRDGTAIVLARPVLKPGNIMISNDRHGRIIAFRMARSSAEKGITCAGLIISTPEHTGPELWREKRSTCWLKSGSLGSPGVRVLERFLLKL